jgi:hypothetical protein
MGCQSVKMTTFNFGIQSWLRKYRIGTRASERVRRTDQLKERMDMVSERKDDQAGDRTQDLPVSWGMLYR